MSSVARAPLREAPQQYLDYPRLAEPAFAAEKGKNLGELWELIASHWLLIASVTVLFGLAGLLYTLPQPFLYETKELIEVREPNGNFLNMKTLDPSVQGLSGEAYVQNQVRILQSGILRNEAAEHLRKSSPKPSESRPDRLSSVMRWMDIRPWWPAPSRESAIQMAAATIKVRDINATNLVQIICESTDPRIAADYTNSLVSVYIEQALDHRWSSYQQTSAWLARQLEELRGQLQRSESQLQEYARASGLMMTASGQNSVAEEKLRQLQQELSAATAARVAIESRQTIASSARPETLPDVLNDSSLRGYQAKRNELRSRWVELSTHFKPDYPTMQQLTDQIDELNQVLHREQANILSRMKNEYDQSKIREQMLQRAYATQTKIVSDESSKLIYYKLLSREVETNRQIYESMLQQVKEAGVASAMRATHVRIVEPASVPNKPYRPNMLQNLLIALTSGLMLAVGFVVVRDHTDQRLRDPGADLRNLQVPQLGVVLSAGMRNRAKLPTSKLLGLGSSDDLLSDLEEPPPVELTTWSATPSPLVESFRAVLASLVSGENQNKVIAFTSPYPREGKTTIISNLAVQLAEIDRKVLLIDADMRQPRLHAVFGVSNALGLSDLIADTRAIETLPVASLSQETSLYGLRLLPSGPGTPSIAKLLYSKGFDKLLARLREEYDMILIDTPPMLTVPDARILARRADGVVLVLRAGHTTKLMAKAAVERLVDDGIPILGTVLNDWNPRSPRRGYYQGYYHYQDPGSRS